MATTSPDNLWSPDPGNNYNLTVDLAAMQASVQAALAGVDSRITAVANRVTSLEADTGWVQLTTDTASGVAGTVFYRVKDGIAYIRGSVGIGSFPAGTPVVLTTTTLPTTVRPVANMALSISPTVGGNPDLAMTTAGIVGTSGRIFLAQSGTLNRTHVITASYPVG